MSAYRRFMSRVMADRLRRELLKHSEEEEE